MTLYICLSSQFQLSASKAAAKCQKIATKSFGTYFNGIYNHLHVVCSLRCVDVCAFFFPEICQSEMEYLTREKKTIIKIINRDHHHFSAPPPNEFLALVTTTRRLTTLNSAQPAMTLGDLCGSHALVMPTRFQAFTHI